MFVNKEIETEIIRLYEREKLNIGNIARVLEIHRDTVSRIIKKKNSESKNNKVEEQRPSILTDFKPFIEERLQKYPKMHASRIFLMLRERGYKGTSPSHVRHFVQSLRKRGNSEAFQRLSYLPAETAQVDWAAFGTIKTGQNATRKLLCFVMTLPYSRAIYLEFFLTGKTSFFLRGFQNAFNFFGGIPRSIIHDNLKSAVIDRIGHHIQFNKEFLNFAQHYGFLPRAAGPYRGSDKGNVERSIRYIRTNFFHGLEWKDLSDLNTKAISWCNEVAMERKWKVGSKVSVAEVFKEESEKLRKLEKDSYPIYDRIQVSIGKTPYARFDTNDYSVPSKYVRKQLEVLADDKVVRIMDGIECVTKHERSYDKNVTFTKKEHVEEIRKSKPQSQRHSALYLLTSEIPEAEIFVERISNRGENVGGCVNSLLKLKEEFGNDILQKALSEVLQGESVHLRAIHLTIKKIVYHQNSLPIEIIKIKDKFKNLFVKHHDLKSYDINDKGEN